MLPHQSRFVWCKDWWLCHHGATAQGQEWWAHLWASAGPLTDIPVEPLAMAFGVHQTSTRGFRLEWDVSKSKGMERRR